MIFDLVIIALVITLEPIPLTAFMLILMSKGGVRKGAAFIFGWLVSLAIVVALTILITGNKPPAPQTAPSLAALAVKLLIGVVLLVVAARRRAAMGQPKKPKKTPKWQTGMDNMWPWVAMGLGPLVQPWGLVAAGVATITEAKLSSAQSYVSVILFCLLSTAIYLAMEVYAGFRPERAQPILSGIRNWIETHMDQVIIVPLPGAGAVAHRQEHVPSGDLGKKRRGEVFSDPARSVRPLVAPDEPLHVSPPRRSAG